MLELVLRIGFSLLVVFGLMWLLAKLAKRPLAGKAAGTLTVLTRTQVSRGASVAVVQVGDRALVVGVTDQQVSLLAETDLAAVQAPAAGGEHRERVSLDVLQAAVAAPPAVPAVQPAGAPAGALAGSALSPQVWRQAVGVLRDRTARR